MNYIVSGLERSGTSMMMRILYMGNFPVAFDRSRKPDINNPRGYFELEEGKIIKKLIEGKFDFGNYNNKFIKITAYGLKFLPRNRKYKIIYMTRDMEEIFKSMEKMSGKKISKEEKIALTKLNDYSIHLLEKMENVEFIIVNYNKVIENPKKEIERINEFLDNKLNIKNALKAIEKKLYRNKVKK